MEQVTEIEVGCHYPSHPSLLSQTHYSADSCTYGINSPMSAKWSQLKASHGARVLWSRL